jgi:hypothetical protein
MVVGRAREPTTNAGPAGMKESASPIDLASLGGDKKIKVRLEDAAAGGKTSSVSYRLRCGWSQNTSCNSSAE